MVKRLPPGTVSIIVVLIALAIAIAGHMALESELAKSIVEYSLITAALLSATRNGTIFASHAATKLIA
eukprot:IDg2156t1